MGQRYIVFLNDRSIEISEIINTEQLPPDQLSISYTNRAALCEEVERFKTAFHYRSLHIFAGKETSKAWKEFCGLFRMIQASGGVVTNGKNQYLFIRRLNKWDLPKGKTEKGETAEEAALREVEEETGLRELTIINSLPDTFHIYTTDRGITILKQTNWFRMSYSGSKAPKPQTEEDITEVKWFTAEDLDEIRKDTYASLIPLLENL